jgi:hypothetical protein
MTPTPTGHHGDRAPDTYAVRVHGRLGPGWSAWFDGLDVAGADDGTTTIQGAVRDQAALHGLLQKVRDVGLPILSVTRLTQPGDDASASAATTSTTHTEGH